jgi:2'-5' RNA ligase
MTNVRLFAAIDPAPAVRDRLRAALAPVRRLAPSAKWVDVASLHLTLAFLGDTEASRVPEIATAIGAVAVAHAAFELGCAGGGAFGGKRPRVLWAGVTGALDALHAVQADLAAALAPLGFAPEERPFAAHLTLARAREARGDPSLAACAAALAGRAFGVTRVEALVLYRSDLSPKGAVYTPLAALPLRGAPGG